MKSKNKILIKGNIVFDPPEETLKHKSQGAWKRFAMVDIKGDYCEYYAWFLLKKGLILNKPLRGAHVTFINDRFEKIKGETHIEKNYSWNVAKNMFQSKEIELSLDLQPYSDGKHWWLRVSVDSRSELQGIRDFLGIGKYIYGFHMTIGYVNSRIENQIHSEYLLESMKNKII